MTPPPAAAAAAPATRARPRRQMTIYRSGGAIPAAAGRVGVVVRELPDSSAVVRLTRGRLWIGVLGALLAGIVALNVVSLGLTSGSGQIGVEIDQLQRDNSALRAEIAEKLSGTRVQSMAPILGLGVPPPADITFLTYNPSDPTRAAEVLAGRAKTAAEPWTPTTTSSPATSAPTAAPTPAPAPASASPAPAAPSAPSSTGGSSGGVGTGL